MGGGEGGGTRVEGLLVQSLLSTRSTTREGEERRGEEGARLRRRMSLLYASLLFIAVKEGIHDGGGGSPLPQTFRERERTASRYKKDKILIPIHPLTVVPSNRSGLYF